MMTNIFAPFVIWDLYTIFKTRTRQHKQMLVSPIYQIWCQSRDLHTNLSFLVHDMQALYIYMQIYVTLTFKKEKLWIWYLVQRTLLFL